MPIQKVLVVDDSKTELMFLTDLLQKKGMPLKMPKRLSSAGRRKPDLIGCGDAGAKRIPVDVYHA